MGVTLENNRIPEVKNAMDMALYTALTRIGMKAEKFAKALCPVGTPESTGRYGYRGGTLRNSISFEVDADSKSVTIGSNVEYAPYVELGTGPNFTPPPEWIGYTSQRGSGIGHSYVLPRPFLRPAIVDHMSDYMSLVQSELNKA